MVGGLAAWEPQGATGGVQRHPVARVLACTATTMTDQSPKSDGKAGIARRLAAWGVHFLTASGAIVAFLALSAIHHGRYDWAFWWMALAMAIDSVDGSLARAVGVKTVLPHFDGTRLDDLIDYLNYTIVPMTLIYAAGRLPPSVALPVAAAVLLASAWGFCQTDAKTIDGYFKGFPSYWNVVVFYLFTLDTPPFLTAAVLVIFAILVFVPIYYVYPSRTQHMRTLMIVLGAGWAAGTFVALASFPDPPRSLLLVTLLYPTYYIAVSVYLTIQRRLQAPTKSRDVRAAGD
jgi:phosphatidylcholine synthase